VWVCLPNEMFFLFYFIGVANQSQALILFKVSSASFLP